MTRKQRSHLLQWHGQAQFMYHLTNESGSYALLLLQDEANHFLLPIGTIAKDIDDIVSSHWHQNPVRFKSIRTAMQRAERMLPGGAWMSIGVFTRFRRLPRKQGWLITSVTPTGNNPNVYEWTAVAVVAKRLGLAILKSHGHEFIGRFTDAVSAMKAADRYKPKKARLPLNCTCTDGEK